MHVKLPATKIFVTKYFNAFLCKSISKKSHQFFSRNLEIEMKEIEEEED